MWVCVSVFVLVCVSVCSYGCVLVCGCGYVGVFVCLYRYECSCVDVCVSVSSSILGNREQLLLRST